MKKIIVLFSLTVCVAAIALFTGCSVNPKTENNNEYQTYYVSGSDSVGLSGEMSEFSPWSSKALNGYTDEKAKKSVSVNFEGRDYTGDYSQTLIRVPNTRASHKYFGGNCFFELDSQSGELTSFLLCEDLTPDFYIDEEEGREIADKFAEKYINLSQYKVTWSSDDRDIDCVYYFTYYREVGGLKTNDTLNVTLNGRGRVVYFSRGMIGSFGNTRANIDTEKAELALYEKLNSLYGKYADKTFTIKDKTLVKLRDGKQGLLYRVETEIVMPSDLEGGTVLLCDLIDIFVVEQ